MENEEDFNGLEIIMDICEMLIYLKEKKDKRYFDICKILNAHNIIFGDDRNGENGIFVVIEEEENEEEMKTEGMRYKLDWNEIINSGDEELIEKEVVGRLSVVLWEIEIGEVGFGEFDSIQAHLKLCENERPTLEGLDLNKTELMEGMWNGNTEERLTLSEVKMRIKELLE